MTSIRTGWRALAAVAAAGLASVTAPSLQAQDPRTPRPAAAAAGGRELSVEDALRIAEAQSEAVRIARAGVTRARGQQYQARSQLLPQLNASAAYQRQLQNQFQALTRSVGQPAEPANPLSPVCAPEIAAGATPEQRAAALAQTETCSQNDGGTAAFARVFASPNNIILGLTGSQTLFAGGRVLAQNRVARAGRRSAEVEVVAQRAQLALDVAQAYYDAALSDRLLAIADSSLVQTEGVLRQVRLARNVGSQSEFELLRAQVTRDNQVPQVVQARANRDLAHYRLKQLLDIPLDDPLRLTTDIGDTTVVPLARTVSNGNAAAVTTADVRSVADTSAADRSSVRQANEAVQVQEDLLRIARAQRIPSLQLSTNYQRFAYPTNALPGAWNQFFPNWTVSLGLSVPIFTGGRIRGDELVAEGNLAQAQAQLEQTRELAALDSRLALSQLEQAEAAFAASRGTTGQAERAFTIAQVRFQEGISTQIELNDSRLLVQQAQANRAQAARDVQIARTRLALLRDLPLIPGGVGQQQGFGQQGALGARGTGTAAPAQQPSQQQSQPQSQQQGQPQGQGAGGTQTSAQTTGGTVP